MYIYHSFLIHSSADGHLGCFHVLAIINSAAMNIGIHVSFSGSFQISQLFASGGQSIGVSASNISPSNEHPGLISFRMDWLDLLAVQGILKSLLQHHSSNASILWCSAFFTVQLSHPYMTTGKTIALTGQSNVSFIDKVITLFFNMLNWS